jgi:hypothetical protein
MKIYQCEKCGKEFKVYPSKEGVRRFCSFNCRKSIYTPEMCEKMSGIKKQQFEGGLVAWNKGFAMWDGDARKNLVIPEIKSGAEHPNWKGGLAYYSVRATRLRENGGSHTRDEWEKLKQDFGNVCPCCKMVGSELVKDHIIPLTLGGPNNIENIQPLCRSCNAKKHTKTTRYEHNFLY